MIRFLERFTFTSALNFYMDYYDISLDAGDQTECTMLFPYGITIYELAHGNQDDFQNVMFHI
jgi:hypothetical protein